MVYFEEGKTSRIDGDISIKKGNWYFGVKCKGCGRWALVLTDDTNGQLKNPAYGPGKLSIPCHECEADEIYETNELKSVQASFNRASHRDRRVKRSGRPRQPFWPMYKKSKITLGFDALERRPAAAQIIARALGCWTYLEIDAARLLALLLKADTAAAAAVYLTLQNARARQDVIRAAANEVLSVDDLTLLNALLSLKSSMERERNAFAHGVFGTAMKIKEGIIWCDTTSYIKFTTAIAVNGLSDKIREDFYKTCYVYELGDLETVAQDIEDLHQSLSEFIGYASTDAAEFRRIRYPQLCAAPKVAAEIERLSRKQQ